MSRKEAGNDNYDRQLIGHFATPEDSILQLIGRSSLKRSVVSFYVQSWPDPRFKQRKQAGQQSGAES
jgi:hypothetical protein